MSNTKTRLFVAGAGAIALASGLSVGVSHDNAVSVGAPAFAAGEGEGGEGGVQVSNETAVSFALGLRRIEAELNAGWAAAQGGDMKSATSHFEAVLSFMLSDAGKALAEEGLDVDHMGDEVRGLIMTSQEATSADEIRDLYEHGLFEVDEHLLGIDPLLRRDPAFAKSVILGVLDLTSQNFRTGQRDQDSGSARRAVEFARIARTEFGAVSVAFTFKDAARADAAIKALNNVIQLANGNDASALLSEISRVELALSGY